MTRQRRAGRDGEDFYYFTNNKKDTNQPSKLALKFWFMMSDEANDFATYVELSLPTVATDNTTKSDLLVYAIRHRCYD